MEPDQLLTLFKRGLIPGPSETERAFIRRVESHPSLPFPEWKEIATTLMEKCGFVIDWIPITYSSKKLLPWEGAVFWLEENGQSLLQLRPALEGRKVWGNSRTEILVHEAIHAAREAFDESKFEEFLAYSTSQTRWKRWLGPFFVHSWEFPFFTLALFLLPLIPWISIPFILFYGGRFLRRLFFFKRIRKVAPFPILLCLTDHEIQKGVVPKNASEDDRSLSPREQLIEALKNELSYS